MKKTFSIAIIAALTAMPGARAHVTLERNQAPANGYYKAVLQVAHGCKASPTRVVRVRIPESVVSVKPQPKPGWTLKVSKVDERVSEVAWSGGSLANEHFDEFKLMMKLPDLPGTTLYLPVVQECQGGVHRWIETPAGGKPASELKEPAPALQLMPRA